MTINVQQAVSAAQNYFQSLKNIIGRDIQDIRLEEVELSEDKTYWLITLGFNRPTDPKKNPLGLPESTRHEREYKIFKINAQSAEVESMKIREV